MHKSIKILSYSIFAICGGLLAFFGLPQTGWKALSVATGSMSPAIPPGSLVLIQNVPTTQLHKGDIVAFTNPANPNQTITHRIVKQHNLGTIPGFLTRGDANKSADRPIVGGNIVGKVMWHAPQLGKVFDWSHTWPAIIVLVILPGFIVIIDEYRRMVRVLNVVPSHIKNLLIPLPAGPLFPVVAVASGHQPKRHRSLDGLRPLVLIMVVTVLSTHTALALLSTTATLTNNTIATAAKTNHIVISQVNPAVAANVCGVGSTSVSISHTGLGSVNSVNISSSCVITQNSNTSVSVSNSSNQTATTGSVAANNSTTSGSATSGSVSNTNSTSTTINVTNATALPQVQSFTLHNPTAGAQALAGWTVTDNSAIAKTVPTITIPAGGFATLSLAVGDGLTGSGDRLILKNNLAQTIDALSWGSDVTILDPAVAAIPGG
ncbi:MAG TPA: signal peptidase I, partial [Candidatus Saccharimonadia bacterium]